VLRARRHVSIRKCNDNDKSEQEKGEVTSRLRAGPDGMPEDYGPAEVEYCKVHMHERGRTHAHTPYARARLHAPAHTNHTRSHRTDNCRYGASRIAGEPEFSVGR
jgi:hypothetical protein